MKDVIIVGGGLAGTTLAWQWHLQGKSIQWFADDEPASSHVAAGVFNPMVLKRFSPVWNAQEQLNLFFPFFTRVQDYLGNRLIHLVPIWRRFHDTKERSTWMRKSVREDLANFMQTTPVDEECNGILAANGFGLVNHSGWLDAQAFITQSMTFFQNRGEFTKASFIHAKLLIEESGVAYGDYQSRHVVFAEGMKIIFNPWFEDLPMQGNKGEVLIIKCPGLQLNQIIKSSVFLMPYKEDLFWVGATYDRDYETDAPSAEAKSFLINKLETFLKLPYEIVYHKSGIRPTTIDRRPFVGTHAQHKNIHVFNGMGSRASLVAPWAAEQLFQYIYEDQELPAEMDVSRFRS
ncbi:NAD(P)/FAD-dependent oxidoreductase [Nonlabens marinus]|uniref:FAD dependent oxidoreductase domain-containing protein n=1 Tax=Nonlabens marinus S1-08 TaxID=1454201 RepID=W8VR14_9FLAO|nr:FAD-binding oxidoreductase [Nonlabens marinus]BAO55385.1 hypothetical protein NMS_1376 [Nonlabens marinus S1-08]